MKIVIVEMKDLLTVMAERRKAIIVIELLGQLFRRCCNACPTFVMGSIKDALHSAFGSKLAREVCFYLFL